MQPSPDSRGLGLRSSFLSRPPLGSRALRPGDSLTIPRMALSVSFIRFVSSADATDATELLTPTLVGLTPTEHVSLRWTHYCPKSSTGVDSGRPPRMVPLHRRLVPSANRHSCPGSRRCLRSSPRSEWRDAHEKERYPRCVPGPGSRRPTDTNVACRSTATTRGYRPEQVYPRTSAATPRAAPRSCR